MAVQRGDRGPRSRNREARPAGAAGGPLPRPARTGNLVPGARTADMLRARMSDSGGGYGQQPPGPLPGGAPRSPRVGSPPRGPGPAEPPPWGRDAGDPPRPTGRVPTARGGAAGDTPGP